MKPKDLPLFRDKDARRVLDEACSKHGVSIGLLRRLLEIQRSYAGSGRQMGITADFDTAFADFLDETGEA